GVSSGDGGPATSTKLGFPLGVVVANGILYIGDMANERIRAVDLSTGIIITVAGTGDPGHSGDGGPATSAELYLPGGVAVANGVLYIADTGNNRVRAVNGLPTSNSITAEALGEGVGGITPIHNSTCNNGNYPVNCASGDFWHNFTDISVPGRSSGLDLTRTYNSLSASTEGIFGFGWASSYDMHLTTNPDGSVTITAEDGSQVTAAPGGGGSYTVPSWADSTLQQNVNGSWTFVRHQTTTFTFSSTGLLMAITDLNGYTTTLSYNSSNQLQTVTDSSGRVLSFSYGSNGLVSQVTDPAGNVTNYSYDSSGNLTSVTEPMGRVTSFTYDANHLLLTMTDPNGGVTTNIYDTSDRVVSQTDPDGLTTTYAYSGDSFSSSGGTTTITDPHGNVETQQYTNGELTSLTKGVGTASSSTWTYAYDPATLGQTSITDPDGHVTASTYDADGNLLTSTDALGKTTTYTYSSFDEPLTVTDPAGITTTYTYDSHGNELTKTVTGAGGSPVQRTTYTVCETGCPTGYEPGDVESMTDPDGHVTTYTYDAYGDRTSTTTHPGGIISATSAADQFTYATVPTVTGVSPYSGSTAGGASVTVSGSGFTGATGVDFGSTPAASFNVNNDTTITATSPAEAPAAITEVQNSSSDTVSGSSETVRLPANVTPGDALVLLFGNTHDTVGVRSISGGGVSWSRVNREYDGSTTANIEVWYGTSSSGGSNTVTVRLSGTAGATYPVNVSEWSGIGGLDQTLGTVNHTGSTTASTPSYPPAYADDLYVGAVGAKTSISGAPGGGFSALSAGSSTNIGFADLVATDSASHQYTQALSASADWSGIAASFYPAPTTVDVTVVTPGGTSATSSDDQFGLAVPPTVSGVAPNSGPTSGTGGDIGIYGTNLSNVSAVMFGTVPATQIYSYGGGGGVVVAVAPPHAPGTVDVTVVTPGGTSSTGSADQYTYVPSVPTVTGVSPYSGSTSGGASVTVSGSGFTGATGVDFGSTPAASFSVNNDNTITATSSLGSVGAVDVTVTTTLGTSATGLADKFTYVPVPTVTGVSPTSGPTAGGTSVTVSGSGFTGATGVDFGSTPATSFSVTNDNTITATSPTGSAGTVDITVTTAGGTSATSSADQFTYVPAVPTVTGISPTSGSPAGGTLVTISGSGFTGATGVDFGSTPAASFSVVNDNTITATSPAGSTSTIDVTVAIGAMTDTTKAVYDVDGREVCEASPNATAAGVSCPAAGQPRVADTTTWVYDADGQVTTETDPDNNTTSYLYDADGNQTRVTDALGKVTKTTYDPDDRVITTTSGYGTSAASMTTSTYDIAPASCPSAPAGTTYCTQSTNGLSETTTTYYNALDHMIYQAPPNTTAQAATSYTYDGVGNVLTTTDGAGTTTYGYDADNRLTSVSYSDTASGYTQPHGVTYAYDADGNRTQMVDGTGTTTYSYDSLERPDSVTNGAGNVITYGYDTDNNLTCASYPNSGSTNCHNASFGTGIVTYQYDGANQVVQMTDWLGNSTGFGYDSDGNLINIAYPSGTSASVSDSYDAADALTDTSLTTGSTTTDLARLTRNSDELIGSSTPSSGSETTYGYDSLNQLTTGTTAGYSYDAANEFTSTTPTGGSASDFSYNADGQLCWVASAAGSCSSAPSGATTYNYDNNGDRLSSTPSGANPTTYGWDQAGDLTCETAPNGSGYSCANQNSSSTSAYAYNGDGLRMSDTPAGSQTQQFTWNGSASVPQLLSDGTNYYLYGPNVGSAPLEQISTSGSVPTYLVSDTTGVREQLDSSGSAMGSMSYDSYGNRCTSCSISTPFGFEGGYTDATGLVYLINRYYDPTTGQFLSVDPLVAQTGQPYEYVNGDPINEADPLGLGSWWNPCSWGNACHHAHNIYEGVVHSKAYTWVNQHVNPAYLALTGYYNEWQAAETGCGWWQNFSQNGSAAIAGSAGTIAIAGGITGAIEAGGYFTGNEIEIGDN
ncbi:MAG: IPT/TIG domain-containing protein, partial [Acidimicrobiales bacterium]